MPPRVQSLRIVAALLCALVLPLWILSAAHAGPASQEQGNDTTTPGAVSHGAAKVGHKLLSSSDPASHDPSILEYEREREEEKSRERLQPVTQFQFTPEAPVLRRLLGRRIDVENQIASRIDQINYSEHCIPPPPHAWSV